MVHGEVMCLSKCKMMHFPHYFKMTSCLPGEIHHSEQKTGMRNMAMLVVEPTYLKNMLVKLDHFPRVREENKQYLSCHHLDGDVYHFKTVDASPREFPSFPTWQITPNQTRRHLGSFVESARFETENFGTWWSRKRKALLEIRWTHVIPQPP